ncbi:MAG: hypothetical protein IJD23_07630, partial [Spirochaetaceae bacterium]|nr:hypothetical protein [Spirochaetaceae bacterium]
KPCFIDCLIAVVSASGILFSMLNFTCSINSDYSFSATQRFKTGFSLSTLILITFTQISSDSTEFCKNN